jgi:hypothetical protein
MMQASAFHVFSAARRALVAFAVLAASAASAAIGKAELAADLGYLRVHSLADSALAISSELANPRALVLDLRYATAGEADRDKLASWLKQRSATQPAFILVSPSTPAAIAAALEVLPRGVVTVGVRGSKPEPVVVVTQGADADRRAFDAADSGMPIPQLISGRIEKERFDEAALVREFRNEQPAPAPRAAAEEGKEKAPVLVDRVLQRAFHLHRALRAIKPRD